MEELQNTEAPSLDFGGLTLDDLNTPVDKSETSREAFADTDQNVPHDKLTYITESEPSKQITLKVSPVKIRPSEKITLNVSPVKIRPSEKITLKVSPVESKPMDEFISKEETRINFESDEDRWLYACSNSTADGSVYNIDKDGNLIAKVDMNTILDKIKLDKGIINLKDEDKDKLFSIIREAKKQINFVKEQENLKDEIKGYPEYNEGFTKLYKPDSIIPRFKTEKNMLRTMLQPNGEMNELRLLLSIVNIKSIEYFNQLLKDKIIASELFPLSNSTYVVGVYNGIMNFINTYNTLPPVKTLVIAIGIPYSKEFFDEYLYDEIAIDYIIDSRYSRLRKAYCNQLSDYLREHSCTSEELVKALNQIDFMTIPPNSDNTFANLRETLDTREKDINLSTGINILDENNAFIQKGKITTVFAYTGGFKTMFCSNTAYNVMNNNGNVLYFSMEINKAEMYINFLSRHSYSFVKQISHSDVKSNRLTDEDKEYLFSTIYQDFDDKLKSHLIIYDETDITSNTYAVFSKLLLQADNYFTKQTGHGVDLVIIDHLNLLKFDSEEKAMNDYSMVNHWMSYFRRNAINFLNQKRQISILCACQSSREGFKNAVKSDGMYSLTGIAEGNEIERSSQLILSIYADDNLRQENKVRMQILKSRDNALPDKPLYIGLKPEYYTFGLKIEQPSLETKKEYNKDFVNDIQNPTNIFLSENA